MEVKENLKGFSIGGEVGWYVTPLHFQTKIWILSDNFYIFPLFYFLTAPSFCLTMRKAVCLTESARTQQEWEAFPVPRTDDCLHLTRHLLLFNGFYKVPILHRLTACDMKGSSIATVKSSAGVLQGKILSISWSQVSKCQRCCFTQRAQHYLFAKQQILSQQELSGILLLLPLPNPLELLEKW